MEKCQCCCPFRANEVMENYKNLKLKAAEDLKELLEKYFAEHPYIDRVYIGSGTYFPNAMTMHRDLEVRVTAYTSED